jgi:hypothetical protein
VGDEQAVEGRQLGQCGPQSGVVQWCELRDAGVEQEALEPDDTRLVQRPELVEVARHGAAPERDICGDLACRRLAFHVQRIDAGRGRDRVEGHVDDRGDATRDRGAGRGGEALPLGAPRLVHVHVAVDQAREQHLVVLQGHGTGRRVVEGGDGGDPAVLGVHGGGPLTVGEHRPPGADDEGCRVHRCAREPAAADPRASSAVRIAFRSPASSPMCTVDA